MQGQQCAPCSITPFCIPFSLSAAPTAQSHPLSASCLSPFKKPTDPSKAGHNVAGPLNPTRKAKISPPGQTRPAGSARTRGVDPAGHCCRVTTAIKPLLKTATGATIPVQVRRCRRHRRAHQVQEETAAETVRVGPTPATAAATIPLDMWTRGWVNVGMCRRLEDGMASLLLRYQALSCIFHPLRSAQSFTSFLSSHCACKPPSPFPSPTSNTIIIANHTDPELRIPRHILRLRLLQLRLRALAIRNGLLHLLQPLSMQRLSPDRARQGFLQRCCEPDHLRPPLVESRWKTELRDGLREVL